MEKKKWFLKSVCTGTEIEMNKPEYKVGRHHTQDLVCLKIIVSREHAKLTLESDDLFITAFKTVNGTWVNGRRLGNSEKLMLYVNDVLNFGYADHPECNGAEEHYCYTVVLRTYVDDMNDTADLLNILEQTQNVQPQIIAPVEEPVVVKQEPQFTLFSSHDEVIEIDDDEDLEIACSQAFTSVLHKFKQEPGLEPLPDEVIEIEDSEDELDMITIFNEIDFSNVQSNGLEEAQKSNGNGDDESDADLDDSGRLLIVESPHSPESSHSPKTEEVDNKTQKTNVIKVKETRVDLIGQSSNEIVLGSKPVVDRSFVKNLSKYHKPEVIEPHVISKDRVGRKRRCSISKEIEEKKKKLIAAVSTSETQVKRRGRKKKLPGTEEPKKRTTLTKPKSPETKKNSEKPKLPENHTRYDAIQTYSRHTTLNLYKSEKTSGVLEIIENNPVTRPPENHTDNGRLQTVHKSTRCNGVAQSSSNQRTRTQGNHRGIGTVERNSPIAEKFHRPEKTRCNGITHSKKSNQITRPPENHTEKGTELRNSRDFRIVVRPQRPPESLINSIEHSTRNNKKTPLPEIHESNGFVRNNGILQQRVQTSNSHREPGRPRSTQSKLLTVPNLPTTLQNPQPSTSSSSRVVKDPRLKSRSSRPVYNDNNVDTESHCHISRLKRSDAINVQQAYPLLERPSKHLAFDIVYWNTIWLVEQQDINHYPPINKDVVRMCVAFSNCKDYVKVVEPFIKYEIWDTLSQGYKLSHNNSKKRFRTSICEVKQFQHYQIAKCITYITSAQNASKDHPKEADVIYIMVATQSNSNSRQTKLSNLFGMILRCQKTKLRPHDLIYPDLLSKMQPNEEYYQLELHILLKLVQGEILLSKFMDAMILTSSTSLMRECEAVHTLSTSPLHKMILNPKLNDFKISSVRGLKLNNITELTNAQSDAVFNACRLCLGDKPGMYLVQGPPGTGKTTVIQNIVESLIRTKEDVKILLVAPSNASVDALVRKLGTSLQQKRHQRTSDADSVKIKMVRLGNFDAIQKDVKGFFIDELAKRHTMYEIIMKHPEVQMDYERLQLRKQELLDKIKRDRALNLDILASELALKNVETQIRNFALNCCTEQRYLKLLEQQRHKLFFGSNVICTTLNSCIRLQEFGIDSNFIDCCILDEASQSKETETLIPLMLGVKKLILVGDPQQLPPVTISRYAKDLDYGQSLFARMKKALAFEHKNPIKLLDVQFRMHPEICNYPNKKFYLGALKSARRCSDRQNLAKLAPYYVFNLNLRHRSHQVKDTYENQEEVQCVTMLLEAIDSLIRNHPSHSVTVGVITLYNLQKHSLRLEINKKRATWKSLNITVNTVDSFQGMEQDIIILSCVRVRTNSFLNDEQRLNVALTRAKQALYVVGTHPIFDTSPLLMDVKENAESRNLYANVKKLSVNVLKSLIEKRVNI